MKNKTLKKKLARFDVAVIMGSATDLKVMQAACEALQEFKISFKVQIISAHRTPKEMLDFSSSAASQGYKVIIAGAGGAAHLPGMVATLTSLPVIGVPVNVTALKGLDALLSVAQMPKGIPVATMAVDNAYNAGLLAARILGTSDLKIQKKMDQFIAKQRKKIVQMNKNIQKEIQKLK